jgi:hypothetical protein
VNERPCRPCACSPLQSFTGPDRRQPKPAASSHGVRSPSASSVLEARLPRACLTRHLPTSGFLTLLPVCFLQHLPALFHAGNAHGVSSFRAFSPRRALRFLSDAVTFVTLAPARKDPQVTSKVLQTGRPVSKALLSAKIRHLRPWVQPCRRPLPSWFSLTSRDFPLAMAHRLRGGSPPGLRLRR